MPRAIKRLNITDMQVEDKDGMRIYRLHADKVGLMVKVPREDLDREPREKILEVVNDYFLNSLRYLKHTGTLPKNPDKKALNQWSQSDTGLAIKPKNDMVKEFTRFS